MGLRLRVAWQQTWLFAWPGHTIKSNAEMRIKMYKISIKRKIACFTLAAALLLGCCHTQVAQAETKEESREDFKIAIDAGHQSHSNSATEPIGPGSKIKKAKVSGGAVGVATKTPEYKLNLRVAKKLRNILEDRGYEVYMIRTSNNVNLSNKQRALRANKSGADIYIRIHADSSGSFRTRGASMLYPSLENPFVKHLSKASKKLSNCILKQYCKKTGIKNRGLFQREDLTGTNWSKIPVTLIEMGFLSNSAEDRYMQKNTNQKKMATGIANGIDDYFGF